MSFVQNAKIDGTMLGVEDHGIMTCWLYLDFAGSGQGFGGFGLDEPIKDSAGKFERRQGCAYGMEFIARILNTVGASKWEDLKGKHCRVRKTTEWGQIDAIGHIIEDKWFEPRKDLAYMLPAEAAR